MKNNDKLFTQLCLQWWLLPRFNSIHSNNKSTLRKMFLLSLWSEKSATEHRVWNWRSTFRNYINLLLFANSMYLNDTSILCIPICSGVSPWLKLFCWIFTIQERSAIEAREKELERYYEYGTLSSPLSGLVVELNTELDVRMSTSIDTNSSMIHLCFALDCIEECCHG